MGLVSSLVSLFVVVAGGWLVIKYIIPKIESGEIPMPGFGGIQQSGVAGSSGEEELVMGELQDAALGNPSGTTEATNAAAELPKEESKGKSSSNKKKKAPYDPSKGMAGKGESSKKKSKNQAKEEFRIIDYLSDDYGYF